MNEAEDLDLFDGVDDAVIPNVPGSVPTRDIDPEPASEPAEASAPEPGQGEPGPPQGTPQQDHVPTGVMLDERRRRQAAEVEAQRLREQQAHINGRLAAWQEQQVAAQAAAQQAQAEPPPDRDEDPIGYLEHMVQSQRAEIDRLNEATRIGVARLQQQEQQAHIQGQQQALVTESQTMQQKFAQEHSDYWDAFNHLATSRAAEYETLGYGPEQVQQLVERDRGNLVASCVAYDANGNAAGWSKNPAEVVYGLAKQRGWQAPQSLTEAETGQAEPVMPASVPNNPAINPQVVPSANRAQAAAAGAAMARPAGGDASPGAPVDAAALAAMGDADFNRLMATNPEMVDVIMGK